MSHDDEIKSLHDEAVAAYETLLATVMAEYPPTGPIVCKAGCSTCCWQKGVTVTAVDVFSVADYLRAHRSDAEIEALLTSLADHETNKLLFGPKLFSWPLQPCPLLKNDKCSVHPSRPLICYGGNSYEVNDCIKARDTKLSGPVIRNYMPQEKAAHMTLSAMAEGIKTAGRDGEMLVLTAALRIALTDPDAKQKWTDGGDVFVTAHADIS